MHKVDTNKKVVTNNKPKRTKWSQLDFFERQQCNSACSSQKARELSLKQRRNVAALENSYHVLTGGKGDLEGFRSFLKHKYGTIARGWRKGLDIHSMGRISCAEFSRALHTSGYAGNVQTLWRNISDGASHVTLDNIDPDICSSFDSVVTEFYNGYDTIEDLWAAFQPFHANAAHIDKTEWAAALRQIGLSSPDNKEWFKPSLVFQMLDAEGRSQVNVEDLRYFETWGKQRGIAPAESLQGLAHMGMPKHRASLIEARRDAVAKKQLQALNRKRGACDLREFRRLLERRFGSVVNAWQAGLDLDGNGKLTMREFSQACRNIGFTGAIGPLWSELDKEKAGFITLGELDREAHEAITTLQNEISSRYSNMDEAWQNLLDADGSGRVDKNEFIEACREVGLGPHIGQKIFGCIDADGTGCITPEELSFLDSWSNKSAHKGHSYTSETYICHWRAKICHREMKERMRRTKSFENMIASRQPFDRGHRPDEPGAFYKNSLAMLANHDDRFSMFSTWS